MKRVIDWQAFLSGVVIGVFSTLLVLGEAKAAPTPIPGPITSLSQFTLEPVASDNHQTIAVGPHTVTHVTAQNNTGTINYLRFYDAGAGFNGCNSAVGLVAVYHIPGNGAINDAGFIDTDPKIPFVNGISICVVSAYGNNTTTAATTGAIDINIGYQ